MTLSELNTRTFRLRTQQQPLTIKMQYRLQYLTSNAISALVLTSNSASLLAIDPDIRSRCSQLINAIKIRNPDSKYFSIDTKVLKGLALRGGYWQEPEYLHFTI